MGEKRKGNHEYLEFGIHHVAIIMDGNGRWAQAQGKPRLEGHRRGVETVRMVVKETWDEKIPFLTLYSFSTENWRRPINEVQGLMQIFIEAIDCYADELHQNQVKVRFIGKKEGFPDHLTERMENLENLTEQNQGLTLNLALNYGGRDEIIRAFQKFLQIPLNQRGDIDEDSFRQYLDTGNQPDPDLLIRTGGEKRLSNYLLWQLAYSELYFTEVLWPDFSSRDYHQALADFVSRKRKFGGLG